MKMNILKGRPQAFYDRMDTISVSTLGSHFLTEIIANFSIPHGFFEFSGTASNGEFKDEPLLFATYQKLLDAHKTAVPASCVDIVGNDYIGPIARVTVSPEFRRIQSPELVASTNVWMKEFFGTYTPVYRHTDPWNNRETITTSHENVARIKDAMR